MVVANNLVTIVVSCYSIIVNNSTMVAAIVIAFVVKMDVVTPVIAVDCHYHYQTQPYPKDHHKQVDFTFCCLNCSNYYH